jgi:CubicO group peptidase (beta-lactamase class C family)
VAVFQKPIWRKFGFSIGVVLLVLLGLAQFFKKDLLRLHFVLTLFQPSAIVENFRSMPRVWDYKTVRRSGPTYRLPYNSKPLPESYVYMGIDHDLAQWIAATATSGLLVVHDGTVAFERYYRGNSAQTHWVSWGMSNVLVSALMGFALEDRLLRSQSDIVADYIPRWATSDYGGVSLEDLLQSSSGIEFDADYDMFGSDINRLLRSFALGTAMDDFALSLKRIRPPGTFNDKLSMDAQVLSIVLREATGRNLSAYLEEKLWSRLGVEADAFWLVDGAGVEWTFGGLSAVLRDYARFGLLFLDNGKNFRGQQLLSAQWIKASVAPDRRHPLPTAADPASSHAFGYGYQWRLPAPPDGDYCAIGIYGQFIYVHPRHQVVIAKTSAYADYPHTGNAMETESLAVFRAIAAHMSRKP